MTKRTAVLLLIAGVCALCVPVVAQWAGVWFPAIDFLWWAGLLMIAGAALIGMALSLEDR